MILNFRRQRSLFYFKALLCVLSLVFFRDKPLFCQTNRSLTMYVSVNGSDHNSGTKTAPLNSIEAARNKIRKMKGSGTLPPGGVKVIIGKGDYLTPEGLEFSKEDSGTPIGPIQYEAEEKGKVKLIAGRLIPLDLVKPISKMTLVRIHPKADPEKLFEIDLKGLNLHNARRFAPANCFSDSWHIIDFFINDRRQPLSQWPNPEENIRNNNDPGWVTCNGSFDNKTFFYGTGGKPEDKDQVNELDLDGSGRSARWEAALKSGHELWLKGFWRVPWEPFTIKVEGIKINSNTIQLSEEPDGGMGSKYSSIASQNPLWRNGTGKEKWRAINLLEEIDYPGEWALDVNEQKIYFYAPAALESLDIMIADTDKPGIRVTGSSNLRFSGLSISGTRLNGVELIDASGIQIAGCSISNVGNNGLIVKGGKDNRLRSNDIFQTGGAGILIANTGNRKQLLNSGVMVENNHIYQIGQLSFREAIQLANSVGILVRHNLMHDMPKSAVRTDMVNNCIFEYNEVHNIALGESDNGAFYNYGGWSTYGNIFRYNFIHHINRSNGFYCDDGDSGDIFYNNIVYDAIDAIKFGGGHSNIAKNNLFIRCKDQGIDDRGIARNYKLGSPYESRLLEMNPLQEPWKSYGKRIMAEYGLKTNLWSDIFNPAWHPEYPNGCALIDNVSVQCGPYLKPKHGDVQIRGNLEVSSLEQASFTNSEMLDFTTSNRAILEKFPKLNSVLPAVGLRKDLFRMALPSRKETGGLQNRGKAGNEWDEDQLIK
ncbi:right-handed parallel beta-helix repeat-containing protein [Desertivirga arenae]|uniref:right-handed parallel beta-helix repeat-containing protein n=1 Tax=Desertivirga arenae TaxID=2810309 RepID=UPI001A956A89|nr:right-handed parallel beta-helix repeat-containing protein [Pedobacter sp. SYSU D00823]